MILRITNLMPIQFTWNSLHYAWCAPIEVVKLQALHQIKRTGWKCASIQCRYSESYHAPKFIKRISSSRLTRSARIGRTVLTMRGALLLLIEQILVPCSRWRHDVGISFSRVFFSSLARTVSSSVILLSMGARYSTRKHPTLVMKSCIPNAASTLIFSS